MELFIRIIYAVLVIAAIVIAYVLEKKAGKQDAAKNKFKTWHGIMLLVSGLLTALFTFFPPEAVVLRTDPLRRAQSLYDNQKYEEALAIYRMPELENDPIALSNQAYILQYESVGEESDRDTDLARVWELYKQAAESGNKDAIANLLTFTLRYPYSYDEVIRVLDLGAQPTLLRFFADYYNEFKAEYLGVDYIGIDFISKDSKTIKTVIDLQMETNGCMVDAERYSFMFEDTKVSDFYHEKYAIKLMNVRYVSLGLEYEEVDGEVKYIGEKGKSVYYFLDGPTVENVWLGFDVQSYTEKKLLRPESFIRV